MWSAGGGGSRVADGRKWLLGRFVTQESMYGTFVRVLFNRIERWVTTKNVCCFSQSHSPFPQRIDLNIFNERIVAMFNLLTPAPRSPQGSILNDDIIFYILYVVHSLPISNTSPPVQSTD